MTGVVAAHADATTVLYVDESSASCSDAGTGTSAEPYCGIQAAANAAVAGDTVDVATGTYEGQLDIKSRGTAAAPIVLQATGGPVFITNAANQTGPVISFDGSSYVSFEGKQVTNEFLATGIEVNGSSNIVINGMAIRNATTDGIAVHIAGTSSNIALTRNRLGSVQIDAGSSGDLISTNAVRFASTLPGISVAGASGTDITSNDFYYGPAGQNVVSVSDGSTGTSIENNIVESAAGTTASAPLVAVDASSAPGTTLDYNVVYPDSSQTQAPYSWAGTDYASASALAAATGQGAHDLNANPQLNDIYDDVPTAPEINSANSSAPGMLATDFYGDTSCSQDPVVDVTGAGNPAYCARGVLQEKYATSVTATATADSALSADLSSTIAQNFSDALDPHYYLTPGPTPEVSYTISWGDGQSQTVPASSTTAATVTAHTYAKPGTYSISDTAQLPSGATVSASTSVTTAGSDYTPIGPKRIFDTRKGIGGVDNPVGYNGCADIQVAGTNGVPANATAVAVNVTATDTVQNGLVTLGLSKASDVNYMAGQTVANSAIVPLTEGFLIVCVSGDSGTTTDLIIDATGYFTQTAAAGYHPTARDRVLDTRDGTGAPKAKVAAKHAIAVPISGTDSIPAHVTAVAVHVTETNATGGGFIAAEPDGAGVPTTSSLNYAPGQTISNTVIVPVAADGRIELYNGASSGSTDLIADVSGYFSLSAPDAFVPVTPFRAVDTRTTKNPIAPNSAGSFNLDSTLAGASAGFPADVTVSANLTATDETSFGHLTAYPAGTALPNASDVNFGKGQNIANSGLFATTSSADTLAVYDGSAGSTDLVIDVFGYFAGS
ncbi:right-handed parallel beta-helix repeat-containing protein [Actinospica sp. MGRD01-02]|uniref:Right-handed parallel beta-helix repeat-containing protein n=1 Tax=Actinospica acidithermotolerans TaxID=2828514 RepID=A0A941IJA8_9ACTN|nr:right-handed parallel beta-helix repeat-containing protein [Actinospica acidithermotolerans]MBR7829244.1 right-handed parallel beta-helix repeat-containing protein [Actinospica acidithermotolerans]